MADLKIVSNNLNVGNDPIEIKLWSANTLSYVPINSVEAEVNYSISSDSFTLTVLPTNVTGGYTLRVTSGFDQISVPVHFLTEYEKDTTLSSPVQMLYPSNMFLWQDDNPKYDEVRALDDVFEKLYTDNTLDPLIPLTTYFNQTFPEYCSHQLIGIAFSLATHAYKNGVEGYDWLTVNVETLDSVSDITSMTDSASALTPTPVGGKSKFILDNELMLAKLKYGAYVYDEDGRARYCRFNKCVNIGTILSNPAPERDDLFTFDSTDPNKVLDSGVWYSLIEEAEAKFILEDWENTQGVPAYCELKYSEEQLDISDLTVELTIPSYSRVPLDTYDLLDWIRNKSSRNNTFAIKFDGKDFTLRTTPNFFYEFFTFDSDIPEESLDRGVWFSTVEYVNPTIGISVANVTTSTISIDYVVVDYGSTKPSFLQFRLGYREVGTLPWLNTAYGVTTLTGLSSSTEYEIYVEAYDSTFDRFTQSDTITVTTN